MTRGGPAKKSRPQYHRPRLRARHRQTHMPAAARNAANTNAFKSDLALAFPNGVPASKEELKRMLTEYIAAGHTGYQLSKPSMQPGKTTVKSRADLLRNLVAIRTGRPRHASPPSAPRRAPAQASNYLPYTGPLHRRRNARHVPLFLPHEGAPIALGWPEPKKKRPRSPGAAAGASPKKKQAKARVWDFEHQKVPAQWKRWAAEQGARTNENFFDNNNNNNSNSNSGGGDGGWLARPGAHLPVTARRTLERGGYAKAQLAGVTRDRRMAMKRHAGGGRSSTFFVPSEDAKLAAAWRHVLAGARAGEVPAAGRGLAEALANSRARFSRGHGHGKNIGSFIIDNSSADNGNAHHPGAISKTDWKKMLASMRKPAHLRNAELRALWAA